MHPDLAQLVILQSQDLEAKHLRDQIAALAKDVAALETQAKATIGQRAVILDLIAKEETLRRKEESDIADLRVKLERNKKKLDMTTTTHQLEALEHEAAFIRSEISRLEDQELESMERSESLDAQKLLADAAVQDSAAALDRANSSAAQATAADHAALLAVEQRRTALRAEILQSETGEASLSNYDRIAHSKGTAVSEAINQQCSACRMMVRPQRWNDLRDNSADSESAHSILTCESCGRMLYYDPARDAPQRKAPERAESIAAQIVRSSL